MVRRARRDCGKSGGGRTDHTIAQIPAEETADASNILWVLFPHGRDPGLDSACREVNPFVVCVSEFEPPRRRSVSSGHKSLRPKDHEATYGLSGAEFRKYVLRIALNTYTDAGLLSPSRRYFRGR